MLSVVISYPQLKLVNKFGNLNSIISDPEIAEMSLERKKLMIANMQNKSPTNRKYVKTNINQLRR